MSRPLQGLVLALVAYVVLRVLMLVTAFDDVAMTMYELHPMGTIPTILLTGGIDIPLRHFYDNAAGQLATGLLATPLYALLGPSYLALKLVPFLLGLGVVVLTWGFLRRWYGTRAATLGALLIALGPATMVKYSLKASGNHFENLFFTMLAVWAVWRVQAPNGRRTARLWIAGCACGLAVFIFLGAIPIVGLLALTHLGLVGWRRGARDFLLALPTFFLGLLPLLMLNFGTRARGGGFLASSFSDGAGSGLDLSHVAQRFAGFFTTLLLPAATYPDLVGIPGEVANALFAALLLATWIVCLPPALRAGRALLRGALGGGMPAGVSTMREAILVPFVLHLPITALAYALSDLRIEPYGPPIHAGGYRYYLPTFLFACLLIAIVTARWLETPRRRRVGTVVLGLTLVTAVFDLGMVHPSLERADLGVRYEGHYIKQVARTLVGREQGLSDAEIVERAESFPPVFRSRVYEGLGFYGALKVATATPDGLAQVRLETLAATFPAERRGDAWRGVGTFLRWQFDPAGTMAPAALELLGRWRSEDPAATRFVLDGLALAWDVVLVRQQQAHLERTLVLLAELPPEMAAEATRGLGIDAGRILRRDIAVEAPWVRALWTRLPEASQQEFLEGMGIGLADGRAAPGWPRHSEVAAGLDPAPLLRALRARVMQLHEAQAREQLERFAAVLPSDWRGAWGQLDG